MPTSRPRVLYTIDRITKDGADFPCYTFEDTWDRGSLVSITLNDVTYPVTAYSRSELECTYATPAGTFTTHLSKSAMTP